MSLGDELRKARHAADLTQEQVSVAAGIDRAYLSLLENDHKSPTVDVLFLICRALGTPASEILASVERAQIVEKQPRPKDG
jgi:transcriptional regulator with XRE-family HTH domain